MISNIILLFFGGCLGGFLAGLLGVGGGLIYIPLIGLLLSQQHGIQSDDIVKFALANSFGLVFLSGVSGIYRQIKLNVYSFKNSLTIGIPGALAATSMSYFIQNGNWYQKDKFQIVFLFFLLISIANMIFGKKNEPSNTHELSKSNVLIQIFVGLFAGIVVSLSGLGGGIVMVPLFRWLLKKPIHVATSLSLSIVPIIAIVPIIQYLIAPNVPQLTQYGYHFPQSGFMVWPYFVPMAIGVIFFSSFGQKTAPKVSVFWLRVIFALLSTIILVKTIYEIFQSL
jgi:uncharacterized membrane protein YfcA